MNNFEKYEGIEDVKAKHRERKKRKRMGVSGSSVKHIPLLQERRLKKKRNAKNNNE